MISIVDHVDAEIDAFHQSKWLIWEGWTGIQIKSF